MEKILLIYFGFFTGTLSGFGTNEKKGQQNSTLSEEIFSFYPQNGQREPNSNPQNGTFRITNGEPYMGPTKYLNLKFQVCNNGNNVPLFKVFPHF